MYPTHILNPIHLVKTIWLVPVKTKGKIPKNYLLKQRERDQ